MLKQKILISAKVSSGIKQKYNIYAEMLPTMAKKKLRNVRNDEPMLLMISEYPKIRS